MPEFLPNDNLSKSGNLFVSEDGQLIYQPDFSENGLYILGHDNVLWVDWFGVVLFVGTLGAVHRLVILRTSFCLSLREGGAKLRRRGNPYDDCRIVAHMELDLA